MSKQKPTLAQMKRLIEDEVPLKVLSAEFGIPVESLKAYKARLTAERNKKSAIDDTQQIQILKNRYNLLCRASKKSKPSPAKTLSKKEEKVINETLTDAQDKINNQESCGLMFFMKICSMIKDIMELNLTYEQAFSAYELLNCEKMKKVKLDAQTLNYKNRIERHIFIRISEAARYKIETAEDVESLRKIKADLCKLTGQYNVGLAAAKDAAERKINKLQLANAMASINDIKSERLRDIIGDIASGTVNIKEAKRIIKEEAEQRMSTKKATRFWNLENEENMIIHQITNSLSKQVEVYPIQNPSKAIKQLNQLGLDINQALTAVVNNLIGRKEFKKANRLCDKYENMQTESNVTSSYIRKLKKDIRYAEISDLAKKLLQPENTPREDEIYFGVLKQVIEQEGINLSAISLGTSNDGSVNITLADIWFSDEQKRAKTKY